MTRWRWPVAVLAAAIVIGTGGYAVAQTRGSDPSYRTAVAGVGDLERTLELSGTVTAAGRRDLTFGAAGSVAKVAVRAGQRVKSGQVLARLDPTSFDAAVTAAVATLAKARAQLASDEDAQATEVTDSSTGTSTGTSTGSSASKPKTPSGAGSPTPSQSPTTDPALQKLLAQLAEEQKSVTGAQSAATEAITVARAALDKQTEACRAEPSDEETSSAEPSADATDPPSSGGSDDGGISVACRDALASVQAAQDEVAHRQDALQTALSTLGKTLGQAVTEASKPTTTQSGPASGQTSGQGQVGGQGQGQSAPDSSASQPSSPAAGASGQGPTSSAGSVTAARLAQDQADIDTARARLIEARAEHQAATLRAPYAGRILKSEITKGDLVAATDPAFVLVGDGATTVTTTVTTAQVPSVRRGQRVTVVPAGWTTQLTGTVSAIGLLPDSEGAFPVTVTVESTKAVAEGTTASLSIVTGSARDAVTIPLTALSRTGDQATVEVLKAGVVTRTQVTVGVVGTRRASIAAGLRRGATVVLADLDATVPSSGTSSGQRAGLGRVGAGGPGVGTANFPGGGR